MLIEEGNHFEATVRELFPSGRLITSYDDVAIAETRQCIANRSSPIFQATFQQEGVLVRTDVLVPVGEDAWDLYEIKASTEVKEEYIIDLAIQRAVLIDAGLTLNRCFLVIADRSYVRQSHLDVWKLTWTDDLTAQVAGLEEAEVRPLIAEAKRLAALPALPVQDVSELSCVPNGADACGCKPVSYASLPDYSVFDVTRLSRETCSRLLRKGIREIKQITPKSVKLTKQQAIQVVLTHQESQRIQHDAVAAELKTLRFPLYFLDYETFNFAVPPLEGFRPYQQFVFQYSLHTLHTPDATLEHSEYLSNEVSLDSVRSICESLRENIASDGGTVIVWHRSFEEARNAELGELCPEFDSFFRDASQRIYDLEDIFKNGYYVDYRFRGRTSIKVVLPVLCPDFNYGTLNVQHGGQAMETWKNLVDGGVSEPHREQVRDDLLAYCKLDTLAMVKIYERLVASGRVT